MFETVITGPAGIRTLNARLAIYIFVDFRDRDVGGYVGDAQKAVASQDAPAWPG